MADSPPNPFSNGAHKWVLDKKGDAVVFVKMLPKPGCSLQIMRYLRDTFGKTTEEAKKVVVPVFSTGFIIQYETSGNFVLTCCHLLDKFYSSEVVVTEDFVRGWFRFLLFCKHNEEYMESNYLDLHEQDRDPRYYTRAELVKLDQHRDLLLLQFQRAQLFADVWGSQCQHPHLPLRLAQHEPPQLSDAVMISWPPERCGTVVIGQVVKDRKYSQIMADQSKGYNMGVVELRIDGEKGTSGSPILDHRGDTFAMYHGRLNGKGYAVNLKEIKDFLAN